MAGEDEATATEGNDAAPGLDPKTTFHEMLAEAVGDALARALGPDLERTLDWVAQEVREFRERQDDMIRKIRRLEIAVGELTRQRHADAA